ncbi:MAG: DUF6516 family protein [Pseudomonadota bacterium]
MRGHHGSEKGNPDSKKRVHLSPFAFAELVIWSLPGSGQANTSPPYKYRLAYVIGGKCVVRFDNEVSKGDHRHFGSTETPYKFTTLGQLKKDFYLDIARWNHENGYL